MADQAPRPRGRRPSGTGADTRDDIIEAARRVFATKGFDGASLRAIAREAGVDPALIHHYFDGKPDLYFRAVIQPPLGENDPSPADIIQGILDSPHEDLGRRWVESFVTVWDAPGGATRFRALINGVTSHDAALAGLRDFLLRNLFGPVVAQLGVDHPELRAQLAAVHVIGLGVVRYVGAMPDIVALPPAAVAEFYGPRIQEALMGPLPQSVLDTLASREREV